MIFGYTRVSTQTQTLENQVYEIKEYCKTHSKQVDVWYEEKVSGTKKARDRELGELLKVIKEGDTIITTEISRIGRSVVDVLQTIQYIRDKGCVLIAIKQNFVLDDSLNSKIMSYIFSIVAEVERELISSRIKEALASRKAQGQKLGRPYGSNNKHNKLESKKEYIEMCLQCGKSLYYLRKKLRCHSNTLKKYLKHSGLAKKYGIKIKNTL